MDLGRTYLVREHFKAGGKLYIAGTVLSQEDVDTIPLAKIRINERKIVRLDIPQPQLINLLSWIKARFGVDAKANLREYVAKMSAETTPSGENNPPPGTPPTPTGATK